MRYPATYPDADVRTPSLSVSRSRQLQLVLEIGQQPAERRISVNRLQQRITRVPGVAGKPGISGLPEPRHGLPRLPELGVRGTERIGNVMVHVCNCQCLS